MGGTTSTIATRPARDLPVGIISRHRWAEVARGRVPNDGDSAGALCGEVADSFGDRVDGRLAGGDVDHEVVDIIVAGA
jgi:hypothetical protein